jgi:mRNA interferase RelE/StbE
MLKGITDRRIREKIVETINRLADEPEKQGKPLISEWAGFRSLRAVGQRYRIIYKVDVDEIVVFIIAVGIRKEGGKDDIYNLARKLLRLGLFKPPK